MKEKQLKTRQVCLFFLAFLIINKLFTLPSTVTSISNNDLLISALVNILIDGFSLFLILLLTKNSNENFYEILENTLGKVGTKIVCVIYFVYFFSKSILPIIEQKEYIELTLYIPNPSIFYFLPFFITSLYICAKKLRILGRLSDILFVSSLTGFIVLMALSVPHADFSNLLPIGVNGAKKILSGSYLSLTWYGDAVYFLFFIGHFKREKKDGVKILLSYCLSAFCVVLFMAVFYGIFSSISYRQKFSLTEISKYTTIINSTGRFDYFAILLLLVSNLVSIALPLFFSCRILNYIFGIRNRYLAPFIVNALSLIITLLLTERVFSAQRIINTYFGAFYLVMANIFPVIILSIKKRSKNENSQI